MSKLTPVPTSFSCSAIKTDAKSHAEVLQKSEIVPEVVFPSAETHKFYSASIICATKDASCGSHPFYFTLMKEFQITSHKRWPVATDTSMLMKWTNEKSPLSIPSVCVLRTLSAPAHLSKTVGDEHLFQMCLCKAWREVLQLHVDKNACCTTNSGDFSLPRDCGKLWIYSIFLRSSCWMIARCAKLLVWAKVSCLQLTQIFCLWRCRKETGKWLSVRLAYFILSGEIFLSVRDLKEMNGCVCLQYRSQLYVLAK